jgi:hypothetical protein
MRSGETEDAQFQINLSATSFAFLLDFCVRQVWWLAESGIVVDYIEIDRATRERALLEGGTSLGILVQSKPTGVGVVTDYRSGS